MGFVLTLDSARVASQAAPSCPFASARRLSASSIATTIAPGGGINPPPGWARPAAGIRVVEIRAELGERLSAYGRCSGADVGLAARGLGQPRPC
jgi:hypothetical protein